MPHHKRNKVDFNLFSKQFCSHPTTRTIFINNWKVTLYPFKAREFVYFPKNKGGRRHDLAIFAQKGKVTISLYL